MKTRLSAIFLLAGGAVLAIGNLFDSAFHGDETVQTDSVQTVEWSTGATGRDERTVDSSTKTGRVAQPPHPLQQLIDDAQKCRDRIGSEIRDYTCILRKHERVDGRLGPVEFALAKVRHGKHASAADTKRVLPGKSDLLQANQSQDGIRLSVHLHFKKPAHVRGRQVLYVEGWRDSKMMFLKGGRSLAFLSGSVFPDDPLVMHDNLYPITEFGLERMVQRMIDIGQREMAWNECEVTIDENFRMGTIDCTKIEIVHPIPRPHFEFHIARIFVDHKLDLPFRYQSFDWPEETGGEPPLREDYTYYEIRLNVGLTVADFEECPLAKMFDE